MKRKLREKSSRGITLIALVITIIVLLILAGVSLSMVLNQNGIFSRAEQATDKYGQAKARETLELVLDEFQMTKYEERLSGQDYENRLDSKIAEIGSLLPKEDENSNNQLVIVEGHIFEMDRSVPKIVDYKGPANGVIVTAKVTQNGDWKNPVATVTGTITKYGGGTVVSSTATATNGVTIPSDFPTTGGSYTITGIATDTVITITTTDSEGKTKTHPITVNLVRDTTPPTLSEIDTTGSAGLTIKFKATATDSQSGLKETTPLHYEITPITGLTTSVGDFNSGTTVELTTTTEETYTITVTATDKAGNTTNPGARATVKTTDGGVIKHIKTPTGLQAVNTKDIYGADVVGYTCTRTGVNWQIFYIDEEDEHRVYLISKDYMAPPTINSTVKLLEGDYLDSFPKAYKFTSGSDFSVINHFKGKLPDNTAIAPLDKFMSNYLKDYVGASASSSNENLLATNLMLNQDMWAEYMSTNNKSDLAFGGPTLPLFQASYNDTCRMATKLGVQKSGSGYKVRQGTGIWDVRITGFGDTSTQRGIYFPGDDTSASGMWLASPSALGSNYMISSFCEGTIGYQSNGLNEFNLGFRPVVALKSSVKFVYNENGSVTIQ